MKKVLVYQLISEIFKTLAHPLRIQILLMLSERERCVCELLNEIGVEQSNLSQHLRILKKQGIIDSRKDGQKMFYKINLPSVLNLVNDAKKTLNDQVKGREELYKSIKSI
ncbi:transcriptional regulator, ArsR family [Thermodesulfobium acidiphilum]|uniref:Transcriptional regulator, ArsR family n=1 Tax=Thermodesulfobium acidiphilum TaxID=1794699 RepID=A0A2R4W2I4_THEAF|nr:metalloregulator ArsR/SmtB family transcription factor [Thermodesulfobium acidiphilum]AWB11019.1 transcriptional regulator, ArsR family [Thermodesulfobium acidiphilum]